MRKFYSLLGIMSILVGIAVVSVASTMEHNTKLSAQTRVTPVSSAPEIITFRLQEKTLRLLVARTPVEHAQGLMNRESLPEADGMIFYFEESSVKTFWNKNTFMDLDLYWLQGSEIVGTTELPSIRTSKNIVMVTSPKVVDTVIELVKK